MRYFFIDRIERIELNKKIIAFKNVTLSEDYFTDHFFGFPVMPGALLIECLAQAGSILFEASSDFRKKALPVIIERAKFRSLVRPGDQLKLSLETTSWDEQSAKTEGVIEVSGSPVMNANIIFTFKEIDVYYPPKTRHMVESIYNYILKDTKYIGFKNKK